MNERHQRVIRAFEAGPAVPDTLRLPAIEAPPARRPAPRVTAVAAVAVAVVAALVVVLATGAREDPAAPAFAAISERPATAGTPASDGSLLDHEFEGVAYPDWSQEFYWMADGARSDTIDGRRVESVFYTHYGHRIAYSVIAGEPLEPPSGAETIRVDGVELHRFRDGPRDAVMFVRDGQTCVLAGEVINPDTLVRLAAWQGDGAVRF